MFDWWNRIKTEIKAVIIAGGFVLAAAAGSMYTGHQANKTAQEQLEVQKKEYVLKQNALESERDEANARAITYQKQIEDAPTTFTRTLGSMINEAYGLTEKKEAERQLFIASKALVSARNDFRTSLDSIGKRLNSDIDALANELAKPKPDHARVSEIVQVLQKKWPAKAQEIELAVRKVLTEIGIGSPVKPRVSK